MPKQTIMLEKEAADQYFDDPKQYGHLLNVLTHSDRASRYIGGIHQEYLRKLQQSTRQQFDKAIIVIDNSGSTGSIDGKFYDGMDWDSGRFNRRSTTRLNEICQRAIDSLSLYRLLGLPCVVTALNQEAFKEEGRGRYISLGRLPTTEMCFDGSERSYQECIGYILSIRKLFNKCCNGTPLTSTLARVMPGEHPDQMGVILNIITDGLPNETPPLPQDVANRNLAELIKTRGMNLKKMNIVLNLATDEEAVVNYYTSVVDSLGQHVDASRVDMHVQQGRINADTIDDFWSEQDEIVGQNPYLSYPLMLHFIRQAGLVAHTELDLLDERQLTQQERYRLATNLLPSSDLSPSNLAKVIAEIPPVYQPQKTFNFAKESFYADGEGTYKPLIDPKTLAKAVIAQQPGFASRQLLKLRNALGYFLPSESTRREIQQQAGVGIQALELPNPIIRQEQGVTTGGSQAKGLPLSQSTNTMENIAPPPYEANGDIRRFTTF